VTTKGEGVELEGGWCLPVRMRSFAWAALTCGCLMGCAGGHRQLRQTLGPGPGPGCASTLDCSCKNGVEAACEQLGTTPKAPRVPRPKEPKPPGPGPVPPLGTGKEPVTNEIRATDKDTKDRCVDYYEKCVEAGGEHLPGRVKKESRCGSCLQYCTSHGFWPEAIYTWNRVRLPCPGI
jgi:hypothetical protein